LRSESVDKDIEPFDTVRHGDMELVHLDRIALPGKWSPASLHANACQGRDGSAGTVIARNPFRKYERYIAGMNRKLQLRVVDVAWRVR